MNNGENDWHIWQGEALLCLRELPRGQYAAIISDPPYASGGMSMGEKSRPTGEKYAKETCVTGGGDRGKPYPDFSGDALAQRAWTSYIYEVLTEARAVSEPGAVCALFVDWRQLPALTDAMQWAGWVWRGVAVWDKMSSRPQKGRFRQQAEFIVWGSNGAMETERGVDCLPGMFQAVNVPPAERWHQTQKPISVMREVVRICRPGGRILDPFAGSGSTIEAGLLEGYTTDGIEREQHNVEIVGKRLTGMQLSLLRSAEPDAEQISI